MADSDNSRMLPSVTRRTLLQIASATIVGSGPATQPAGEGTLPGMGDPALALWRDWQAVNRRACALGLRQARLEARLVDAVGFPQIDLSVPGRAEPVIVSTDMEIERWLGDSPALAAARERAKIELAARRRAWSEMDRSLGYSQAQNAESEAQEREEHLLEALWKTPARSYAGAAGKLHALLRTGEPREGTAEFPWPQIRLLLADLLRLVA